MHAVDHFERAGMAPLTPTIQRKTHHENYSHSKDTDGPNRACRGEPIGRLCRDGINQYQVAAFRRGLPRSYPTDARAEGGL